MNKLTGFLFVFFILGSCTSYNPNEPHIKIETGYGDIEVVLYPEKAPKTVAAFLSYIDSGLYDNASFYRVLKNENVPAEYNTGLIQGGIFKTNTDRQIKLPGIGHESPKITGISHVSGIISLARTTPGSASSEFFICIGDQKQFDSSSRGNFDGLGYAAFGLVVKGMNVVSKIQNKESNGDSFVKEIKIDRIKRL